MQDVPFDRAPSWPGVVPATHELAEVTKNVDGRDKPGQDETQ